EPVLPAGASTEVTVRVVEAALKRVIEALATPEALKLRLLLPAPQPPAAGEEGAVLWGLWAAPLKVTHWVADVQAVGVLPNASLAVTVSVKATPAVCVPGVESVKLLSEAGLTVKLPLEPD